MISLLLKSKYDLAEDIIKKDSETLDEYDVQSSFI